MDMKSILKVWLCIMPLFFVSCSEEESNSVESKSRIICTVDKFVSDNQSRTKTDPDNGFLITWASGDVIGIFPYEGYQEPFVIPTSQIGNTYATFDGGYWALKKGLKYNAYYPFDKANFESANMKAQIPVTYIGQGQNGTSCDIGAYDYTYSDWQTASGGAVNFSFHHLGAIGVFTLTYPATTTYTQLILSVDDALIPLKGTYDLTATDVSLAPDESSMSTSLSLGLTNCSGVAGETGTFYMMLPPMDLSNNEVTLTLTSASGTSCTYTIEKAMTIKKGKLYRRTGTPKNSKVKGTVDGWLEDEEDTTPYVTFTAEAEQTLTMSQAVATLEYSVNGGKWKELGTNTVTFGGSYKNLRLRGKSKIGTRGYIIFGRDTFVSCKGDIRTLVDFENYDIVDTSRAQFTSLFKDCTCLTTAPDLPATTLASQCYMFMFEGCTNLTKAPKLPTTTLTMGCYSFMFQGCTNLTSAPELPATTLVHTCYQGMFYDCENLTTAPKLPATTLASNCYESMFSGCTQLFNAPELPSTSLAWACYSNMFSRCNNLKTAPELPATALTAYCYDSMFQGCTSLTAAPKLPATILTQFCYNNMFYGCENLTAAPELPAKTLEKSCYSRIFYNCKKLSRITMLATDVSAESCLSEWVWGVASTGTFTKSKEMASSTIGYYIPTGWTVLNYEEDNTYEDDGPPSDIFGDSGLEL